ncbi:uncharacterized protein A1O9_01181 [Exophiala aquamarina CBS 119918]|uniref:Uncharacterized protein n=1 Tax=Exophiala aquamarina CBS 119918 TaxID=1182545 RepID=A0A072PSY4_9EURO|nr:uncharacterized protein A1O9_01181 [Exophiala aquamarina CBS 119918]KEF63204.1 hypothetical protein A1O9_01181 [Exophiala aquamarina CBS 119918]
MNSTDDAPAPQPPPPPATANTTDTLPPEAIALASRFFDAARHGQLDLFEQALPRGLPANLTNDKGDSLLMLAAYHGHAPLVSLLLQQGADPNRLNDRGQSPLAGVVFKNERDVIRVLLEAGADPELGQPSALEATRVCLLSLFFGWVCFCGSDEVPAGVSTGGI